MQPCPRKVRISSTSTAGSITIPSPSTQVTPSRRTPRRDEAGDVLLAVDDQGMPGVGAAGPADDEARLLGQEVDDLPLALVAPLNADDDYDCHG